MRKTFRVVRAIQQVSGWTWSDETGATITPELESSWAAYTRVHKDAKPFKNRGWRHLNLVSQIMPSNVQGENVYRGSNSTVGRNPERAHTPPIFSDGEDEEDTPTVIDDTPEITKDTTHSQDTLTTDATSRSLEDSDDDEVDVTQVSSKKYLLDQQSLTYKLGCYCHSPSLEKAPCSRSTLCTALHREA